MGVVYQARDKRLKRLVALKVIRGPVTPALLARLRVEAEAVARLNHPHIVQIHEIGRCPGGADGHAAKPRRLLLTRRETGGSGRASYRARRGQENSIMEADR
jgi:serine/threonine protein kinase